MDNPEINKPRETSGQGDLKPAESPGEVELDPTESAEEQPFQKSGFLAAALRNFERAWQAQRDAKNHSQSRKELQRDKTRTLVGLVAFVVMMILLFVFVFSSPPAPRSLNQHPAGTPDLGRRVTPGQQSQANVSPLLSVNPVANEPQNHGLTTAKDIALTAKPRSAGPLSADRSSSPNVPPRHTLADVHFDDQALDEQYAMHGTNPPPATALAPAVKKAPGNVDLKTPSLVFVSAGPAESKAPAASTPVAGENGVMNLLPVGTHLVARLEAPVSTALQTPAVAVIEYNYEQDGEIILPAGTQVIGKLRGATPEGGVSLEFDQLNFQDGTAQKISATAMGLDYRPLKGHVTGRNRGLRFLVQSLTGVGEVAAYMVGGSPGSTSVFSEDALLREQLAANMAMAGQQQFNQLAMTQHVVVTVPGNTRFYLVLEQGTAPGTAPASVQTASRRSKSSGLPSQQELMELIELKREFAAAASQANPAAQPVAASEPQ